MSSKPKVAVIGVGGTIMSVSPQGPLDIVDYNANPRRLEADEFVERYAEVRSVADIVPIRFKSVPSTMVAFPEWKALVVAADEVVAQHPDLAGIVILHGTATLEETAYALNLTAKVPVPIVITGSQRPASALSGDAGLNFVNAVRTAASPASRGLGVLVCLNDEIHAAREVTKTSTGRLQAFRVPDFGALGHADGDSINYYRTPVRRHAPDTEFDIRGIDELPRVDIAYAYAGDDGTAVRAFAAAGARGIVVASLAPGLATPGESAALAEAVAAGVTVMFSSRVGSGRVFPMTRTRDAGFLVADNLNPQKARILLSLVLLGDTRYEAIERIFSAY